MTVRKIQSNAKSVWRSMKRSKPLTSNNMATPLNRCLTVFDLTLLGIGNMAGSGIYVLTGTVVRDKSGPATFISYMIAGVTAFLNAICYAELASRIPKAGSAYIYTYIASGEFLAFLIGWSVILEYVLSVSSVARGWSGIVDSMTGGAIKNKTVSIFGKFPENAEFLGDYPDFIGFLLVFLLGLVLSRGPKLSVHLNSTVTICNLCVIVMTCITMLSHVKQTGANFAPSIHGGFLPHGFGAMIGGAGTCFYAFIGFDAITVSCEEALDPKSSMPIASAVSVGLVTTLFIVTSAALVLFVPWWEVDRAAAYTAAFTMRGINWARYITGIGSILGLTASLFTSMYAMPRIVYSMAQDGLLPNYLGYILPSTQVPIVALAIFGFMSAVLTFLCDIHTLADFLSIGTLIAYTIACVNVCILRYLQPHLFEPSEKGELHEVDSVVNAEGKMNNENDLHQWPHTIGRLKLAFRHWPILRNIKPGQAPLISLWTFVIASSIVASLLLVAPENLHKWWAIIFVLLAVIIALASIFIMFIHEQNTAFDSFKVPMVPFLPCLSIFCNICLILKLSPMTWVRFFIWIVIGLVIYFGYGIRHSSLAESTGETDALLNEGNSSMKIQPVDDYTPIDESQIKELVNDAMQTSS